MKVHLSYGKQGLDVTLPSDADSVLLEPKYVPGLADEVAAMQDALRHPTGSRSLRDIVSPDDTVAIVFSDLTRPSRATVCCRCCCKRSRPSRQRRSP